MRLQASSLALASAVAAVMVGASRNARASCAEYCTSTTTTPFIGRVVATANGFDTAHFENDTTGSHKGPGAVFQSGSGYDAFDSITNSGGRTGFAIEAVSPGTGGAGTFAALYGNGTGSGGTGVLGTGFGFGVLGQTTSAGGVSAAGVNGVNSGTGGYGVYGYSSGGFGVEGTDASNGAGVRGNSDTGNAVIGVNNTANTSTTKAGVYGSNTTGGYAGYFVGPVYVDGTLTVNSCQTFSGGGCSDSRLKHAIQPIAKPLERLLSLKGVTFEWIDPSKYGHQRELGTQRGFIAQDVEKVFPEWVDEHGYVSRDGEVFSTLDLHELEALEVESLRELKVRNDSLRAETEELDVLVGSQRTRIERLKEAIAVLKNGRDPISGGPGVDNSTLEMFVMASLTVIGLVLQRKREGRVSTQEGSA
jgi:hypothetical protein